MKGKKHEDLSNARAAQDTCTSPIECPSSK